MWGGFGFKGRVMTVEARRWRLRAEFWAFFLLLPLGIALFLPARMMFPALFAATALGVVLLHTTPGFRWRSLLAGSLSALPLLGFAAVTLAAVLAVSWWATGGRPFAFAGRNPELLAMILLLYPLLSALPQEIVFRALFFRRYRALLPRGNAAILLNAGLFATAHLMYWSWVVGVMTFVGGLAFAWAYARRRSFLLALAMHALAGQMVFALGLGMFFYTGNVQRPF